MYDYAVFITKFLLSTILIFLLVATIIGIGILICKFVNQWIACIWLFLWGLVLIGTFGYAAIGGPDRYKRNK